mmetsp:Transcript_17119/g.19575  ORF Transcript_17119/g.19575 Transcript_17119/m.19575 type:complete len:94 (-) Transcript_17119:17-298(-)
MRTPTLSFPSSIELPFIVVPQRIWDININIIDRHKNGKANDAAVAKKTRRVLQVQPFLQMQPQQPLPLKQKQLLQRRSLVEDILSIYVMEQIH